MAEAQKRDAVKCGKFWFRKNIISLDNSTKATCFANGCSFSNCESESETPIDECVLMSINDIINGKENQFPGLVPLLRQYLSSVEIDADTHCTIHKYLELISSRASGKLITTAQWIRNFVQNHPNYNHDSIVNDRIAYDLLVTANKFQNEELFIEELVGNDPKTRTTLY